MSRCPASATIFKATELSTPPDNSTAIFTFGLSSSQAASLLGDATSRAMDACGIGKELHRKGVGNCKDAWCAALFGNSGLKVRANGIIYVSWLESVSPGMNGIIEQVPLEMVVTTSVVALRDNNRHLEQS